MTLGARPACAERQSIRKRASASHPDLGRGARRAGGRNASRARSGRAADRAPEERHARAVDEVRVARGRRGSRRRRGCPARGGRGRRGAAPARPPTVAARSASSAVMPHVAHRERDAEGHRGRVARAGVAVGRDRDRGAGVDHPAGVRVGLAGREVGRRQEGGDGLRPGQRLDVGVVEVGAVIDRRGVRARPPAARPGPGRAGCRGPAARGPASRPASSTARDCSASKAPRSQKTSIQRQCGAQAASISPQTSSTYSSARALVLGRDDVGAEEGDVVGEPRRDLAQPPLGLDVEPVARLDLDRRDPGPARLGEPRARPGARAPRRSPPGSPRWSPGSRRPRTGRRPSGPRTPRRGRRRRRGGCGSRRSRGSRSGPPASIRSSAAAPARLDRRHHPVLDHQRRVARRARAAPRRARDRW